MPLAFLATIPVKCSAVFAGENIPLITIPPMWVGSSTLKPDSCQPHKRLSMAVIRCTDPTLRSEKYRTS